MSDTLTGAALPRRNVFTLLAAVFFAAFLAALAYAATSHGTVPRGGHAQARTQTELVSLENQYLQGAKEASIPRAMSGALSLPRNYRVHPGDTLNSISVSTYGDSASWRNIWWDNQAIIPSPDTITRGQRLYIGTWHTVRPWLRRRAREAIPAPAPPAPVQVSDHGLADPPTSSGYVPPSAGDSVQQYAAQLFGGQYSCAASIIVRESGWNVYAANPSTGAYGIPQALPGSKMASAGADWASDGDTQLRWMFSYVGSVYGGACSAWSFWQAHGWY